MATPRFRSLAFLVALLSAGQPPQVEPLPARPGPLTKALMLLREQNTGAAREELARLMKTDPGNAELCYQLARAHLLDFYTEENPAKRRLSLNLAMEALSAALNRNADHIPSLRAKSVIHARAELLYYDPNLAYELAARVVKLEPNANAFLISLSEWMSGEVRFTHASGHRVPHDPLLGLDRSLDLMGRVIDNAMPFSNEETAALFIMAKTLSRRGNFSDATLYYRQTLKRQIDVEQRLEAMREMAANYYRMGDYPEAARTLYELLQIRSSATDQWLLKVTLDQMPGGAPPLPKAVLFPAAPKPAMTGIAIDLKDIAPELGLDRFDGNGTVAFGDIDGDGDLDLLLAGSQTFMAAYRNDKGSFTDVTAEVGLAKVPSGYSLNLADYDNDGRPDLYISYNGWSGPMPNRLYRNVGGRFEDVSARSGAADPGNGFVSLWGDLDNDGWLDLAIANGVLKDGSVPQIYRNNRDGTFTNVTKDTGIVEPPTHGAIGIALGDYDRDGDLDLLINGLDPAPNRLYRNEGGWRFKDVTRESGIGAQPPHNGFVCFFFDYNNDAYPDILTTSLASWEATVDGLRADYHPIDKRAMHPDVPRLFRNNRNGTFSDVTFEARLYHPMGVMGAAAGDLDNDGYIDLYFGNGDPQLSRLEPNRFFRNNGDGTFTDLTAALALARPGNKGHGAVFADIDNDGDLDLYTQLGGHYPGDMARNAFYRNRKGNTNQWLAIDLVSKKSNRDSIGAQVIVRQGEWLAYREVKGSEGFGATSPKRVHFGLGKRGLLDSVEVRWPSGAVTRLAGVRAGQVLTINEEQP